jgi:dienelactone hydrolase
LSIEWSAEDVTGGGVIERSFRFTHAEAGVPGLLWLPPSPVAVPPPVVLLGHGGSGHKRGERIVGLARWFAAHPGLAALALDGPHHGDRVEAPMPAARYQALIADEGIEVVLDRTAGEWRSAVDTLGAMGLVDSGRLGYVGVSMGTRFGLPLVAGLGDRFRCAVLGKFGLRQSEAMPKGLDAPQRVARDAGRITAPVLFHLQWHDEIFPTDGQLALFDLIGSRDKRLIGCAGRHAETDPAAVHLWRDFISSHLVPGG